SMTHAPVFQAVFDHRQGMRRKQSMGDFELELLACQASKVPHDVSLDIIDDAAEGDRVLNLIVRSNLYMEVQDHVLVKCIVRLAASFSRIPNMALASAAMFSTEATTQALFFSQGGQI
ncbi:hypothetical protein EJ03DRAFT_240267, partial [Teratosphaeria nubilosa]